MSFHPSASIDCHLTPMELVLPFIQQSMQDQTRANNIGSPRSAPRSIASHSRKTSTSTIIDKTCCDYHSSTGQYVFRCPPNRTRGSATGDRLLCLSQIQTLAFYQALVGEFVGTMLLTLICTSTGLPIASKSIPDLHGALAGGFTIATLIIAFGHISGSHINPAVTVSFLVACEIDAIRAFCYIGMQLLGAVTGSCILRWLAPENAQGNLGLNTITEGVTVMQAVIVEAIITFLLCYTVHAICDTRREDIGGSKALAVGLAITVGCLFGGPYTGASMNPARSFGPATVLNTWQNHWVYWLGPMLGSVVAAVMYTYILRKQPPIVVRTDSHNRGAKGKTARDEFA